MMGPVLGGWFTEYYSWRYVFYINLPIGILCSIGVMTFMRWTPNPRREAFDFFGFLTLSVAIGAFQLMLDRGTSNDWFSSTETWVEATIAGLALYLFIVHTVTTIRPVLLQPRPAEKRQFHRRHGDDVRGRADHDRLSRAVADDAAASDALSGLHDRAGDGAARGRGHDRDVHGRAADQPHRQPVADPVSGFC